MRLASKHIGRTKHFFIFDDLPFFLDSRSRIKLVSKRSDDVTEDVCSLIGIPKAIIDNVLLCSQEEADWPIRTDLEVMTNFDKLSGIAKYNNALENVRQFHNKYDANVNDKRK